MKYTIQTKILAGFILGLMAIGLIGYEVHNQMTGLASSLYKKTNQQNNLVVFQKILSTLAAAESSVRTFSITNNPKDIELFQTSKLQLEDYLESLKTTNQGQYKDLHNHIDYKIYLMQRMLELKKQNPSENLLDEVLHEINEIGREKGLNTHVQKQVLQKVQEQPNLITKKDTNKRESQTPTNSGSNDDTVENADKEKNGFFHRLFKRKQSKEIANEGNPITVEDSVVAEKNHQPEDPIDEPKKQQANMVPQSNPESAGIKKSSIEESLKQLKREKSAEAALWKETMLVLIKEDARIMNKIRENLALLEQKELDYNSQFIAVAARSKNRIINNTKIIAIGAFTIIFFLSLVVFNDFKKIRNNRQSLIDEKDKASRLAKVKEEFLANMSHEIRTPMNAIVGYSELLEKTKLDKDQYEFVTTIQQSSNHLMVILNDILDYSKLESGKLTIDKHTFSPKKCIEQVVKSMKTDAEKKENELEIILDESMHKKIIGDSVRFQQILYNLVSNAIKFTNKGKVSIEAKGIHEVETFILQVTVKDSGIGINQEHLSKIFENFEQLNTGRERKYGGTGLGLAIVKRLVDLQNGTIHVKSEEDRGSTFVVRIPYNIAAEQDEKPKKEEDKNLPEIDFKNMNLLAVDDQEYNLELIKIILNKWGANVDLATSGEEAIEFFQQKNYDLILMDVQMPQMSGLEATQTIRMSKKADGKKVPIVALTAASTKEETERCLKAGMNDYLLKPFKQNELRQMIIKQKSLQKDDRVTPKVKNVNYSIKPLQELSGGDKGFVINMLEVFIKNTRHDLKKLEQFVNNKNWRSAGLQAHKMIAPSRHLGIQSLVTLLEKLEKKGVHGNETDDLYELYKEIKQVAFEATHLLELEIYKLKRKNSKQAS